MSISAVNSTPATASNIAPTASTAPVRAADGDYKVRSAHTSQVKDSDGDYKSVARASSPAPQSSNAVQTSLTALKLGG